MPKIPNRPHDYIVWTEDSMWAGPCRVRTMRIPHGKTFEMVRGLLPESITKLAVVSAYSAATAKAYAAQSRGIRCSR